MKMYDADNDGKIRGAELDGCPALKAAMAQIDTTGDGAITADEITERIKSWQNSKLGRTSLSCTVLRNGRPLPDAEVQFVPETFLGENVKVAQGKTDRNGMAMISVETTDRSDPPGVAPGLYRVEIDNDTLRQVSNLYRLVSLNAANSAITDGQLAYFSGLSNLASLVLQATPITDAGLVHLRSLHGLEALHLSDTRVSDLGLNDIAAMRNLKVLDLSRTKVTDAGLKQLAALDELRWLLLAHTEITDAGLDHLASLKNLKRLTVIDTKVSAAGVTRLKQAMPSLSVDRSNNVVEPK